MSLYQYLDAARAPDRSLIVVNRTAPAPLQTILETTFENQAVTVSEDELPEVETDRVVVVDSSGDGGEVIASSPLSALEETILMVNSDLYKTGSKDFENFRLPEVLARLDEVPFRLRSYPRSHKEKLLLIAVSRFIEHRAWQAGHGTLRASFQRLSRIRDERGTYEVYDRLADSPVRTHVYGRPDWQPAEELDVVSHAGETIDFRDSWFVIYTPEEEAGTDAPPGGAGADGEAGGETADGDSGTADGDSGTADGDSGTADGDSGTDEAADPLGGDAVPSTGVAAPVALLALETEPGEYRGYWTFRPSLVRELRDYVVYNL